MTRNVLLIGAGLKINIFILRLNFHLLIIDRYFASNNIRTNPDKFKLHYYELRHNKDPYSKISAQERIAITNDMFNAICHIDCTLISASINKRRHAAKYVNPIGAKAYTLLACLERFQFFLEDRHGEGITYYEEFTNSMRRKITKEVSALRDMTDFYPDLCKIKGKVRTGKPVSEVMLQFADFFVYAPHIMFITSGSKRRRWEQIQHRYYDGKSNWKRRGFVCL